MFHVVRHKPVGDKTRIIAGCIAGCYYDDGFHRPDMGPGVVEMRSKQSGRVDLVNIDSGRVTPLVREGRLVGRAFA